MNNFRHWIQLLENTEDDDIRIAELGQLLDLWGESANSSTELQQKLLALQNVANYWSDIHGASELYRGYLPTRQQLNDLQHNGSFVIVTPSNRPLASWSLSQEGAENWITGFDSPWIIIEKPVKTMRVYINFVEAIHDIRGFWTNFDEVIMIMSPQMRIMRDEIVKLGQGY